MRGDAVSLFVSGIITQLPIIPTNYDQNTGLTPILEKDHVSLSGGGLQYGYFGRHFAISLLGNWAVSEKRNSYLSQQKLWFEIYPSEGLTIIMGGFHKYISHKKCHNEPLICDLLGESLTRSRESGGYLGIGAMVR